MSVKKFFCNLILMATFVLGNFSLIFCATDESNSDEEYVNVKLYDQAVERIYQANGEIEKANIVINELRTQQKKLQAFVDAIPAETKALYKLIGKQGGNLDEFIQIQIEARKVSIDSTAEGDLGFKINTLLPVANDTDPIFEEEAVTAINTAYHNILANNTRGAFKTALKAYLDTINTAAKLRAASEYDEYVSDITQADCLPKNRSIKEITRVETAVTESIVAAVRGFLQKSANGDDDRVILASVFEGDDNQGELADQTRQVLVDMLGGIFC